LLGGPAPKPIYKDVGDPVASGIAVANGVVHFTTVASGKLVALDPKKFTGVLYSFGFSGGDEVSRLGARQPNRELEPDSVGGLAKPAQWMRVGAACGGQLAGDGARSDPMPGISDVRTIWTKAICSD
jgi:PQQ-like domain